MVALLAGQANLAARIVLGRVSIPDPPRARPLTVGRLAPLARGQLQLHCALLALHSWEDSLIMREMPAERAVLASGYTRWHAQRIIALGTASTALRQCAQTASVRLPVMRQLSVRSLKNAASE